MDSRLDNVPYYALVMLLMRRSDSDNLAALGGIFPGIAQELQRRYNAPAGLLESDRLTLDQALDIGEQIRLQAGALLGRSGGGCE